MQKAYEVMTHELTTCAPDASVAEVANLMLEHNIGDVLVVENNKLCGIVTDRDLAVQALTGKDDPLETPIDKFMSTKVITGQSDWPLDKVAKTMSKYQIRRLPIIQNDFLVGIISLGDVSRYADHEDVAAKSLQAISTPAALGNHNRSSRGGTMLGFGIAALATGVIAWLNWSQSGREIRNQIEDSSLYQSVLDALSTAVEKIDQAVSGDSGRYLPRQTHSKLPHIPE